MQGCFRLIFSVSLTVFPNCAVRERETSFPSPLPDEDLREAKAGFVAPEISYYVINLDRSPERLKEMKKEFEKVQLTFERFPAMDGKKIQHLIPKDPVPQKEYMLDRERKISYRFDPAFYHPMNYGELGNYISIYSVLKKIGESKEEIAVIMEDDVRFVEHYNAYLNAALSYVPDDWDMLFLYCQAGCDIETQQLSDDRRFLKLKKDCVTGNQGYLIKKTSTKKLTEGMLPIQMPSDFYIANHFDTLNAYCTYPNFVGTAEEFDSTIDEFSKRKYFPR